MKFKSLMLLTGFICLSSCGVFRRFHNSGIFDDAIGRDALFSDTTFESIPTHDHIDCALYSQNISSIFQ